MHLSYVRQGTGHALIGARQWIPREQVTDPVTSRATGLPPGLRFRLRGSWRSISARRRTPTGSVDFICGDEVYGGSNELR